MAFVLADRVQQTGTANTTVSFTLSGSVTGYQSFSVIGNTNTTYYAATDSSGGWEVGLGTYSTTGPTLTRTTVYASSNAGSAVTFSGTVTVFVTYPALRSLYSNGAITTNATYYPAFSATNAAGAQEMSTSTSLTYNPSTGALSATSHVSSSDERLKTNWVDLPLNFLELLAQVKHGVFDRTDTGTTQAGVSAQSLNGVLPQAVVPMEDGYLTVDYGPAALVACVKLAQRVLELERKLEERG